jgi:hypothetical protein
MPIIPLAVPGRAAVAGMTARGPRCAAPVAPVSSSYGTASPPSVALQLQQPQSLGRPRMCAPLSVISTRRGVAKVNFFMRIVALDANAPVVCAGAPVVMIELVIE